MNSTPRSITPYDPDATLKYSNGDVYKGEAIDNVEMGEAPTSAQMAISTKDSGRTISGMAREN